MNNLVKEYKIYQIANKNVFGGKALKHGLLYTFKSFADNQQAVQWIINEGKSQKEYIILEVFKKPG